MDCTYILKVVESIEENKLNSYLGGSPRIPENIALPVCTLCGNTQTFFFQIELPEEHRWNGLTIAMFSCTSCYDENYLIPEMLQGKLHHTVIPKSFLKNYQRNFKILTFKNNEATLREDYVEKITCKPLELIKTTDINIKDNKVGGNPNWLLEDETPDSYINECNMVFLIQFLQDYEFDILDGSPGQMKMNYFTASPEPSTNPYYELFLGNNTYFFGTENGDHEVYVVTQI